jgi:hypothetical protein
MNSQEIQESLPQVYEAVYRLLADRLEKGNMEPFYKTSAKMRAWMNTNGVREIGSVEWYDMYYNKTKPMPEGYVGVIYEAKSKRTVRCKPKRKTLYSRTIRPNPFYFEIPTELIEKALVLGCFP